jgi:hypothetical protein
MNTWNKYILIFSLIYPIIILPEIYSLRYMHLGFDLWPILTATRYFWPLVNAVGGGVAIYEVRRSLKIQASLRWPIAAVIYNFLFLVLLGLVYLAEHSY